MMKAHKRIPSLTRLAAYGFILPPMLYLVVFMFWPLGRQMYMSLTNTRIINPNHGRFVGLGNYERLFSDPSFFQSVRVTLVYAVLAVIFGVSLGVISALAIDRPFRGRA
ncbi:MAG: sugar ABC transporter permease, partial [Martelella sp.]